MKLGLYVIMGVLCAVVVGAFVAYPSSVCHFPAHWQLEVDTVRYGQFSEWIPQTGTVRRGIMDSSEMRVVVEIDELYLSRITTGLKATTRLDNQDFSLRITNVYPQIANGSFQVEMNFDNEIPETRAEQKLRLRIYLSEPSLQLLLPVGAFFSDTHGKWVFVVSQDNRSHKREIKLGRKTVGYFEVIEGLTAGDRVITSSYELFHDRDSIDMLEIAKFYE